MTATAIEFTRNLPLLARGNPPPVRAEHVEAPDDHPLILRSSKEEWTRPEDFGRRSTPA